MPMRVGIITKVQLEFLLADLGNELKICILIISFKFDVFALNFLI